MIADSWLRLSGSAAGAVKPKHLRAYLDEFVFRRKTDGVARIAARIIESTVAKPPLTMRALLETVKPHLRFAALHASPA